MGRMVELRERCGLLKGKWAKRERAKVQEARRSGEGE
jgi:hypothetical protein